MAGRRFRGARLGRAMVTIALCVAGGAAAAGSAAAQQRVAAPSVQLVEEKAPKGRECGQWMALTWRACKPEPGCKPASISSGDVSQLLDAIQAELDTRTERTCKALGCTEPAFRKDTNHFACQGSRTLCMERSLEIRCEAKRTAAPQRTAPAPQRVPSEPKRVSPPQRVSPEPETPPRRTAPPTRAPAEPQTGVLVGQPQPPPPPGAGGPGQIADQPHDPGPDPPLPPHGGFDLTSFDLDCVDPEVETPPNFTTGPAEDEEPLVGVQAIPGLMGQRSGGTQVLSFQGASALAGAAQPQALGNTCSQLAHDAFYDGLKGPSSFPGFHFPAQPCNDLPDCATAREGWMRAHYFTWAARAVIHLIASKSSEEQRRYLWKQRGLGSDGKELPADTAPEWWFGGYDEDRFRAVKRALDKLWDIFQSGKTGSIGVELRCPTKNAHPGNVCFTKKPAAHHIVKGQVDLCYGYFKPDRDDDDRGRLIAHELLHHLFVKHGNVWVAVQDTHYHGHGLGCGLQPETDTAYGVDAVREFATYKNSNGNDCGHRARNVRNNDTYAHFVRRIGSLVYSGKMSEWPNPPPPTPPPPQCVGDENCLCEHEDTWAGSEPYAPDGDWRPDRYCGEHLGFEMTCQETKVGGDTVGICKSCEALRGPGCECDDERPCQEGSCYGDDTFDGGVGHCFEEPPPSWACLVDCKRLLNSDDAWCYYDYPTGKARCMDHLCERPDAYACHAYQDGRVCRYGDCVVECESDTDCATKGYPGTFTCQSHRCEFSFPTE